MPTFIGKPWQERGGPYDTPKEANDRATELRASGGYKQVRVAREYGAYFVEVKGLVSPNIPKKDEEE